MRPAERLDGWQQRCPRIGFPLAVIYKFADDFGPYLAALITYYAFVALFPALLLAATALSVILVGHPNLQVQLLQSTIGQFPAMAQAINAPKSLSGGAAGVVLGILGALYGSLGAAQAFQYAANTIWQVPRNSRPNPFAARGRSLLLLSTVGLGLLAVAITSLVLTDFLAVPILDSAVVFGLSATLNVGVFVVAFRMGTARPQSLNTMLPGAVFAGVLFQALQRFGSAYVSEVVARASTSNAVIAGILGLLAYLYLSALVVVFAMEINVVRRRHLWPRALLTPFTDNVDLTSGDQRAYAGQARATRAKGFEQIDVQFGDSPVDKPTPGSSES